MSNTENLSGDTFAIDVSLAAFQLHDRQLMVATVASGQHDGHAPGWQLPVEPITESEDLDTIANRAAATILEAGRQPFVTQITADVTAHAAITVGYAALGLGQTAQPHDRFAWISARDEAGVQSLPDFDSRLVHASLRQIALRTRRDWHTERSMELPASLLPETFTLRQLRTVHEAIHAKKLNKDSFNRTALLAKGIRPTGTYEQDVSHRPAEFYSFS